MVLSSLAPNNPSIYSCFFYYRYEIGEREPGDTDGEVLVSFQLVPKSSPTSPVSPIPSLEPRMRVSNEFLSIRFKV